MRQLDRFFRKLEGALSSKLLRRFLGIALALGIGLSLSQLDLSSLEAFTYDLRMKLSPNGPPAPEIVLVSVDPLTLERLGRGTEIADYQIALEKILKASPLKIISFIDPVDVSGTASEKLRFAERIGRDSRFVFSDNDFPDVGLKELPPLPAPFHKIPVWPGPITSDKRSFAKDGVTRRLILSNEGVKTTPVRVAEVLGHKNVIEKHLGTFDWYTSKQAYIRYNRPGHFQRVSFSDLLEGTPDPAFFENKIVLLGRDTLVLPSDYRQTPYSKDITAMPVLDVQANSIATVLANNSLIQSPKTLNLIFTLCVSLFTVYVISTLRPTQGIVVLSLMVTSILMASYISFVLLDYSITLTPPLLSIFVSYYFFIPYRLIVENRRSWEYQQKNKLLTQVEELKTNFLKMMSHDLKTPLARIQGMTQIVLNDSPRLSSDQEKAVQTIRQSSEELTDFVGSVLSLNRIESKEMKLNLKSRDINTLIMETIKKCEYLAQKKKIQIVTELEPLFSVKMDDDLIRQVLTNLVENAIKYSPNETKILITSEEIDGRVQVQVADQGFGIPQDESHQLFSKFYRSEKWKNSDVIGSGLGLYLSKYFVDLHNGEIYAESEPEKGSTFTVELPMEL